MTEMENADEDVKTPVVSVFRMVEDLKENMNRMREQMGHDRDGMYNIRSEYCTG